MAKKLKVLVLSHSSELGGAERSMIDLFDYWDKKGLVEPHFIIRRPLRNIVKELKHRKWKYDAIHYTNWSQRAPSTSAESLFRNAKANAKAVKEIESIIKELNPDMVMTNTIVSPWAALAAYFQNVPHVWFVREYGDIDHQHVFEMGRESTLQDIDSLSDLVVTNSKTLANHVEKYITPNKIQPLYTPFDLKKLIQKSTEIAKNPFKFEDSLKLVITGRISPTKGQDEAAKAIGQLSKEGYNLELCIIGTPADPKDEISLKKTIEQYGIAERVHLLGHLPNPLSIIKLADIGIMASQQEAFGRVTFEYMATGRPVIGANSGATPELIDEGVNGFLYKKGDADDLAKKVLKYLKNRELVLEHGAAAKTKTATMMKGKYDAEMLFQRLQKVLISGKTYPTRQVNYLHKLFDAPQVADKYIKESGALSIKRMIYNRTKNKLRPVLLRRNNRLVIKSVQAAKSLRARYLLKQELNIEPKSPNQPSPVTIVVPIYGDWQSLEQCIESLKRHVNNTKNCVMLVNDCGPDVDTIEENILKSIKGVARFSYYRNDENLGFVGTCNRAVQELDKSQNDILLLNSDTKVTEGFLEEMQTVMYLQKDLGVVSPRSNNATICTIPLSSMSKKGIDKEESYKLFKKYNKDFPQFNRAPTAHGFCMLIWRPLINEFGLFDAAFGKGYGEEVDFCRRIGEAGYRCAIANHAYVFHLEARSFSMETKALLLEQNNKIIRKRYPDYKRAVTKYIETALREEEKILGK